ncbi:hypothetical protein IBX73_04185 [candidate division WOR-3 bacterium]|nr:hypothetical protein [candidate division WOR-3 bacterium]
MVRGIIVGHGTFAQSMLKTVEEIIGKQPLIEVVSNAGLSGERIREQIEKAVSADNTHETIVFVDLPGGSCTISCYGLIENVRDLNVICGVNLPILLEFFMLREKYAAHELVPILVKKGKESIFKLEKK